MDKAIVEISEFTAGALTFGRCSIRHDLLSKVTAAVRDTVMRQHLTKVQDKSITVSYDPDGACKAEIVWLKK